RAQSRTWARAEILRRYISFARANREATAVADVHLDGVPLPVFLPAVVVADVVLHAQFIGQALRGGAEIAEPADDFGAAAGVVGDRSQRVLVHVLAACPPPGAANRREADLRRVREAPAGEAAPAARKRNREARTVRLPRLRCEGGHVVAVHAERVDHHFALANQGAQLADRRPA